MSHTEIRSESDKGHTRTTSLRGGLGGRGSARNNTRYSSAGTRNNYRGKIEAFEASLALKYEKSELKKSFDVFRENIINYTIKELKNYEDVLVLVQDMEDPKSSLDTKNEPKDLNEAEAKSEVKKSILAAKVRQYIEREKRDWYQT